MSQLNGAWDILNTSIFLFYSNICHMLMHLISVEWKCEEIGCTNDMSFIFFIFQTIGFSQYSQDNRHYWGNIQNSLAKANSLVKNITIFSVNDLNVYMFKNLQVPYFLNKNLVKRLSIFILNKNKYFKSMYYFKILINILN